MDLTFCLLVLSTAVAAILGPIYLYFAHMYTYWKKRGVPHLQPTFPFGNGGDVMLGRKSLGQMMTDTYNAFREHKICGSYFLHQPQLLIHDPELIRTILVKDFDHFQDHGLAFDETTDPLRGNLFFLNGDKWKKLRVKLSPTFTSGKMKMMFQTLVDCGHELGNCLEQFADRGETVEMKEIMARFGTDIISSCAFGIKSNCLKDPDAEFRRWGRKLTEPSLRQIIKDVMYVILPSVMLALKIPSTPPEITRFFSNMVRDTVEYREKNNIKRNDFMQLLIQLKNQGVVEDDDGSNPKPDSDTKLTILEMAAQAFVFFQAGFETSSTTTSFCLYELSVNPDIQERLRTEIDRVLSKHEGNVTYEAIQEMTYLEKVISETLRKYPPLPFLSRECSKDYRVPGTDVVVQKGYQIGIPIMGIQTDPKYFPDPEKFDPERFSEEEKSKRHHYTYLPFGEGPRICIGMRFGLMQIKVGLVTLLSRYEFQVCEETAIPLVLDPRTVILFAAGGMKLRIKKRSSK